MATDKDNVKIEINIAGEFIQLTIPYAEQKSVRECERAVNTLFAEWRHRFPRKTNSELMAMIAYQYAYYFHELSGDFDSLAAALSDTSAHLDSLLNDEAPGE